MWLLFDKFENIKKPLTLPIKIIGSICLASGLLLYSFRNPDFISFLFLENFNNNNKMYLSLVFILSFSILFLNIVSVIRIYHSIINNRMIYEEKIDDVLSSLNLNEKSLIRSFYLKFDNTLIIDSNNGMIRKLEHYKIIYKIKDISIYDSPNTNKIEAIYAMNPLAYDYWENYINSNIK